MRTKKIEELWSHVHWLNVLAAMGTYTSAAQRLGVSKAAMSQRISELERSAGVPLVRRTTRSVRLTEAGQQLVDATKAAFNDIERSFAGVKDLASTPSGVLRVTAPMALGRQQIVPLVPGFLRQYPNVRLHLDLTDRLSSLAQEGFDLAIRHATSVPDTHVSWTLCATRTLLVASSAYLRRQGTPATPEELVDHNCLTYLRSGDTPSWTFESIRRGGLQKSVAIHGSFATNNSEVLREAALAGVGIALLPDFSACEHLAAHKLIAVLPHWRSIGSFGTHLHAIRPYSTYVPRAVQAFVVHVREAFKGGFEQAAT
jgi:DNA-binding transcriptional LysR family regulator